MKLVRVTAPHFVAGFVVDDHKVITAAPILAWLLGRSRTDARKRLLRNTSWTFETMDV